MKILPLLAIFSTSLYLNSQEIILRTPSGELKILSEEECALFDPFLELLQREGVIGEEIFVDLKTQSVEKKTNSNTPRDYHVQITPSELNDIKTIVNTLGMGSLTKIAKNRSQLNKAGDRIDHIHPLKFLAAIFTDEEMKTSMHAMQSRGWVWGEFFGGLKDGLEEEANLQNLTLDMIVEFATTVKVDFNVIHPVIEKKQWKQFVSLLIDLIPRKGDTDRYKM